MQIKNYFYNNSPVELRPFFASVYGYYLQWLRYGSNTKDLIEGALLRDNWNSEKWKNWQEEILAFTLNRAATRVPFYRDQWQLRRRMGDKSSWEILQNWPILKKEDLRNHSKNFIADDCNIKCMFKEHTSGTTGTPVTIYHSRKTVQNWYAIYEARIRIWNDVSRKDRWGIFGGQIVVPQSHITPPYWVWNSGLKQLYFSSYHISPKNIKYYIEAMNKYKIVYILSYPSAIYTIAHFGLQNNLNPPELKVIISNAEPLYDWQKDIIYEFFKCPVRNTYGMSEIVSAAGECSEGNLHLFPDVGFTEILNLNNNDKVEKEGNGRLICTGLVDTDMPLIRYEVGDLGSIDNFSSNCSCGRSLPILNNIEGRLDDMIITPDGRHIGRLDPVFKSEMKIKEAQIIQEALDLVHVKVVPTEGFNQLDEIDIKKRIEQRLGASINVVVETVAEIPRTKAGKFKAVISNLKK